MTGMDRFVADGIRAVRRVIIGVVGLTIVVVGIALLVLPGPAFVVIPIGLGVLALEFEWARRWLRRARRLFEAATQDPASTPLNQPDPSEDTRGSDASEGESRADSSE